VSTPVTPCAPEATVAFLETSFGPDVAKALDPAARVASVRTAGIVELRRCGDLRHAERYGWLSLAGWLLGMPASAVGRLDPCSEAILHRAGGRDVLPDPLGEDAPPGLAEVCGTHLRIADPRDPLGARLLELTALALRDGVVDVGGRRVGGGAVAAAVRGRLEVASRG